MIALLYLVCLFAVGGASFALMYANIRDIQRMDRRPPVHPEAPEPGEEVVYVDLSREKLEKLYEDS